MDKRLFGLLLCFTFLLLFYLEKRTYNYVILSFNAAYKPIPSTRRVESENKTICLNSTFGSSVNTPNSFLTTVKDIPCFKLDDSANYNNETTKLNVFYSNEFGTKILTFDLECINNNSGTNSNLWIQRKEMMAKMDFYKSSFRFGHDTVIPYIANIKDVINRNKSRKHFLYFHGNLSRLSAFKYKHAYAYDYLKIKHDMQRGLNDWSMTNRGKLYLDVQFSCHVDNPDNDNEIFEWQLCDNENKRMISLRNSTFSLIISPPDKNVISSSLIQQRLYESLIAGSIPVILGKNVILPYHEIIQWEQNVIRFPSENITKMADTLSRLSSEKIAQYQVNIKRIVAQYFTSDAKNLQAIAALLWRRLSISAIPEKNSTVQSAIYHLVKQNNIDIYSRQNRSFNNNNITLYADSRTRKFMSSLNLPKGICSDPMMPCVPRVKELSTKSGS